jgi:uncharacterized alpha/beta hydrolase family protein
MLMIKHIPILAITFIFLCSCSLIKINEQTKQLENLTQISGSIDSHKSKHPVFAILLKQYPTHIEIEQQTLVGDDNKYQFNLLPGKYLVGAYIDENDNQQRETHEKSGLYNPNKELFQVIDVRPGMPQVLSTISITTTLDSNIHQQLKDKVRSSQNNIGQITSLDNPKFSAENASLGLWQPITFLNKINAGLYMLQAYQEDKIPVVFVHGILGHPAEFNKIISSLDSSKYQPWVLYYPSGIQLDVVSKYFLNALNQLEEEYNFNSIYLITHSMGGLMSRSLLMKHQAKKSHFAIPFYMTINSPLYGLESAKSGVEQSPIVIPSWRDLAIGSEYIKKVHRWHIPKNTEYHLVFSYLPNEVGDGIVPLNSQLSLSLQNEAKKIYGFEAQHAKILKDDLFIEQLNNILSELP